MFKIIQPTDLPRNKDKDWLKRATKAVNDKDLTTLGVVAKELDKLTTKEKERFVDDEFWNFCLEQVSKAQFEKEQINFYKSYLSKTKIAHYRGKAETEINGLQYIIDERDSWLRANKENTRVEYESYVEQFPKSDNIQKAKERLSKLVEAENKVHQEWLILIEKEAWEKALRLNTKNSYKVYLSNYSNHLHSVEAKGKIEDIKLWEKSQKKDTIEAYKEYCTKFKNGQYVKEAKDKQQILISDKEAWAEAKDINTLISYNKYLLKFPYGEFVEEADIIIFKINQISQEKETWKKKKNENTTKGYEEYLSLYSKGIYAKEAKEKIEDIKFWDKSQKKDTIEAYKEYCTKFGNGQFVKEANDKQQVLISDKKAWEQAKDTNTLISYTEYLLKFPYGKFVDEADKLVAIFNLDKKIWDEAKKENTQTSYREYLDKYPNGIYEREAKKIISDIDFWKGIEDSYRCKYIDWWKKSLCFQSKYKEYLNDYPNGIYINEANKSLNNIKILHNIVSIIGVIALIISIYFIFFNISNTKMYIEPYNAKIYINGKQVSLSYGDEYELPKKINTIKVEKEHYVTQERTTIEQGVKSVEIYLISFCNQGGKLFKQKKYNEALKFLEPVESDSCSWFYLGYIYSHKGERKKSIKYYTKDCEKSYMPSGASCNNLGVNYDGYDNYEAFKYYKKSSELGDEYGHCNLAKMYYNGEGTSQSTMLARKYFNKIKYHDCSLTEDLNKNFGDSILNAISILTPED
jgi:hypothetical protein